MGIRFFCPNGHRLNVKSELAGKVGFCPKCKAKMLIPTVSTREPGERCQTFDQDVELTSSGLKRTSEEPGPFDRALEMIGKESGAEKTESFQTENDGAPAFPINEVIHRVADESSNEVRSRRIEFQTIKSGNLDDPDVQWYFSSNGISYGPATGPVVKKWISERRIGPQMFVWRKDWTEWTPVEDVFPEIKEIFEEGEIDSVNKPSGADNYSAYDNLNIDEKRQRERLAVRASIADRSFYLICILSALVVVLLIILIVVLLR